MTECIAMDTIYLIKSLSNIGRLFIKGMAVNEQAIRSIFGCSLYYQPLL